MIEYRKLEKKDIATFIDIRIKQLIEEGAKNDYDLRPYLHDYYDRHIVDGSFLSWIALEHDKIIGTSGLTFIEKPPYFGCCNGKTGILSSMYTDKKFRRRGIAKQLLKYIIDEAKKNECSVIQITASDTGMHLYSNFGFVKNENFMQFKIL